MEDESYEKIQDTLSFNFQIMSHELYKFQVNEQGQIFQVKKIFYVEKMSNELKITKF